MNGADSGIIQTLAAIGLLVLGAALKFAFDRWGVQIGLSREEKRAQDGKIERVDTHARTEIDRIERELGNRLKTVESDLAVMEGRMDALPTADDVQALERRVADLGVALGRDLSGVTSKVDGMASTVKTILDHILARERG